MLTHAERRSATSPTTCLARRDPTTILLSAPADITEPHHRRPRDRAYLLRRPKPPTKPPDCVPTPAHILYLKYISTLLTIILLMLPHNAQARCEEILSAIAENGWSTANRARHWRDPTHIIEALSPPHPIYIESPYFDPKTTYTGRIALRYSDGWAFRYVTSPPLKLFGNSGVDLDGKEVVRTFLTLSGVRGYELPHVHVVQKANRANQLRSSVLLVDNADIIVPLLAELDKGKITSKVAVQAVLEDGIVAHTTWPVEGWNAAIQVTTTPCIAE